MENISRNCSAGSHQNMLHESYINHEFVVKLIIILVSLHVLCWSLVYYLAFRYRLVCIGNFHFLHSIDRVSISFPINSFRVGPLQSRSLVLATSDLTFDGCALVPAIYVDQAEVEDSIS